MAGSVPHPEDTSMRRSVSTDDAPKAIGPYSQAILCDGWLWCSGQVALDPATGHLVNEGLDENAARVQARRVLTNLAAVVAAGGCSLADVVRCTVYLADIAHFAAVNEVYAEFFGRDGAPPARATVEVSRLPKGALVEIDCVARAIRTP
jgi:2-iminobutanoate/2-iminopropanoate deaminase